LITVDLHFHVCVQVRWHVENRFQQPDLKFFVEEIIPEHFELDGVLYLLSYYILPPRRPAPVRLPPVQCVLIRIKKELGWTNKQGSI